MHVPFVFSSPWQNTWEKQFKGGNLYFGSWFWKFLSILGCLHCLCPVMRQKRRGRSQGGAELLTVAVWVGKVDSGYEHFVLSWWLCLWSSVGQPCWKKYVIKDRLWVFSSLSAFPVHTLLHACVWSSELLSSCVCGACSFLLCLPYTIDFYSSGIIRQSKLLLL